MRGFRISIGYLPDLPSINVDLINSVLAAGMRLTGTAILHKPYSGLAITDRVHVRYDDAWIPSREGLTLPRETEHKWHDTEKHRKNQSRARCTGKKQELCDPARAAKAVA